MKKSVKIITLALSVLLLIGAVIGITVSAETEDRISIVHKNLSYEGAIRVLYALDVDALEDGESVALVFTDKDGNFLYENGLSKQTITLNGKTYSLALSNGISPKDMRKTVCATAVIKDANGVVVASSETCEYSIWQYAINRFEKSPSEDQLALYTTMLNYGASVQKVLMDSGKYKETELLAAGGYANEYCGIQVNTYVDLEKNADGAVKYYAPGTEVALGASKTLGESVFDCYRDADNKQVGVNGWNKETVTAEKPGKTVYSSQYITTGATPITFDSTSLSENNVATVSNINLTGNNAVKTGTYTDTTDGNAYSIVVTITGTLEVVDGELVHARDYHISDIKDADGNSLDKTPDGKRVVGAKLSNSNASTYPEIGNITLGSAFNFKNQTSKNLTFTYRSVFEIDLCYTSASYANGSQGWFLNESGEKVWGFTIGYQNGGVRIGVSNGLDNNKLIVGGLGLNEWINLRFEYYDLANHDFAVFVYVNGELYPSTVTGKDYWSEQGVEKKVDGVTTYPGTTKDAYFDRFQMNLYQAAAQLDVKYDNFYFVTESLGYGAGLGYAAGDADTLTYDYYNADGSVLENVTTNVNKKAMYEKLGFLNEIGTSFGKRTEKDSRYANIVTSEDGNRYLLAGNNNAAGSNSTGWLTDTKLIGETYVFETDLVWYGSQEETVNNTVPVYIRVYDSYDHVQDKFNDDYGIHLLQINDHGKNYDTYSISTTVKNVDGVDKNNKTYSVTLPKGEWINMRLEVEPVTETTGRYTLYINGHIIYSAVGDVNKTATATTNSYEGAFFYTRATSGCSTNYSYAFDNTYLGSNYKGDYYKSYDITGTRYNFSSGETIEVYDPETAPNGIYSGTTHATIANNNKTLSITGDGVLKFAPNGWYGVSFANKGDTKVNVGDTIVFELDYNLVKGTTLSSPKDKGYAFWGFTSSNENNANMAFFKPEVIVGDDAHYKIGNAVLEKDKTYNIRIEYTYSVNDKGAISKIANLFIDNVASGTLSLTFGGSFTFDKVTGVGLYYRSGYAMNGTVEMTFDNVYFGIIRAETETPAE